MLYVRVILCSLLLTNYALALLRSTMKDPVQLSVFRRPKSVNDTMIDTSSWPRGRSKGLMFQRILGISPGKPFVFNLDKWQALQHCGLFSNLTARSIAPTNDSVQLLVSGIERPSIVFAPELAVASTLTNPEVSGGVRL